MGDHSHIIGRQIFDIEFSSKEGAHELQNTISKIFNTRLMPLMETMLDEQIPSNRLIRIDTLTLDLGSIHIDDLESRLADLVQRKFEQALRLQMLHDNQAAAAGLSQVPDSFLGNYLAVLEYFLLQGSLPWWAGNNLSNPGDALDHLHRHAAAELRALLLRIGTDPRVRTRLTLQFSEEEIKRIIAVLEPSEAEFIFGYHARVVSIQQERSLVKSENKTFSRAVWDFILTYLLVDRGSHFNRKMFVRSTLQRLAAHFNLDFSAILNLFSSAIRADLGSIRKVDSLEELIFELAAEEVYNPVARSAEAPRPKNQREELKLNFELLSYFLKFKSLPKNAQGLGKQELNQLLRSIVAGLPESVSALIREEGRLQEGRLLMVRTFDEDSLGMLVEALEPGQGEFIKNYVAEVKTTHNTRKIVQAQSDELAEAVWEFVLEYLLVDRGSEFNRQMFLESNIRRLANRFNVNYKSLLLMLAQNIGLVHHSSTRHIALFQGLSALIRDADLLPAERAWGSDSPDRSVPSFLRPDLEHLQREITNRRDVLMYWLDYGVMPWWEGAERFSPIQVFRDLLTADPETALLLTRHAGTSTQSRLRMLSQLPFDLLFSLLTASPDPGRTSSFGGLSQNLDGLRDALLDIQSPAIRNYQTAFLSAIWEVLRTDHYAGINEELLIRTFVTELRSSSDGESSLPGFLNALQDSDPKRYTELRELFRGADSVVPPAVFPTYMGSLHIPHPAQFFQELFQERAARSGKRLSESEIREEALALLRHFLTFGSLSERFRYEGISAEVLVRTSLTFLFKEYRSELSKLLQSEAAMPRQLMKLHELSAAQHTHEDQPLISLMQQFSASHVLRYLSTELGASDSLVSVRIFLDTYLESMLSDSGLSEQFLLAISANRVVSEQMAAYLDSGTLYRLIASTKGRQGWGIDTAPHLQAFHNWLDKVLPGSIDSEYLNRYFRSYAFLYLGRADTSASFESFMKGFFKFLHSSNYQLLHQIIRFTEPAYLQNRQVDYQGPSAHLDSLVQEIDVYRKLQLADEELQERLTDSRPSAPVALDPILQKELEQIPEAYKRFSDPSNPFPEPESIYIRNAGLVLLHPFLGTYFKRLNMFEKGDFISEEARLRAVHLLQYLVFGTEKNEEHELVLNKIFCNVALETPLPLEITLTDQERSVSNELLHAVISQWDKLKNTSAESLQASFLQRDGALSRLDDAWTLKVEQRGYDVLLQTLPWGLGMVRTPWMNEFIYIEWI